MKVDKEKFGALVGKLPEEKPRTCSDLWSSLLYAP